MCLPMNPLHIFLKEGRKYRRWAAYLLAAVRPAPTKNSSIMTSLQHRAKNDGVKVKPTGPPTPENPGRCRKYISQIKITSWNVRTMIDNSMSKCQATERCPALIASELQRLHINCIPGVGELTDGECTFLYSRRDNDQSKQGDAAIIMKSNLRQAVVSWKGIKSRIITMCIVLSKHSHATFISVYAPTF